MTAPRDQAPSRSRHGSLPVSDPFPPPGPSDDPRSLDRALRVALQQHGDRLAVSDPGVALSYRELDQQARQLAAGLPAAATGDRLRVGITLGNTAHFVLAYLAVLRAGAVPFLLDAATGPAALAAVVHECGLDLLLQEPEAAPLPDSRAARWPGAGAALATGPRRRPALRADTAVCRFTSGSTGTPKCIEFSAAAVLRAAANWTLGTGLTGQDRVLSLASPANGLAFNTALNPLLLAGGQLHLERGLPTAGRAARALQRTRATRLVAFPALYESFVRRPVAPDAFTSLRMAVSSAAPLRSDTRQAFTELSGVALIDYYGAAETGPLTFAGTDRQSGLGLPLPGVEIRAGSCASETAPIEVRSESMGSGYLNAPGAFAERMTPDGYYRTGDAGFLGPTGLHLTGRTDRVVNVGGRKVDANAVEAALDGLTGVRDAVVLEVPDQHGAGTVAAVFEADTPVALATVHAHVADRLAAYQIPSLIRTLPALPRGSTGKVRTAQLAALFEPTSADAPQEHSGGPRDDH